MLQTKMAILEFWRSICSRNTYALIIEVCDAWRASKNDPSFWSELEYYRNIILDGLALFTSPADLLNILMGPSFILKEMSSITLALIR